MGAENGARAYEFGGFRLDASQRRLSGADGATIELPSRAFDLLLYMVERPGELLDKSTLLGAIWPKTVVEESSLTQCIYALRRALGDQTGEPRFIATLSGRGYQFIARVRAPGELASTSLGGEIRPSTSAEVAPGRPHRGSRRRWAIGAAATALLLLVGYLVWQSRDAGSRSTRHDSAVSPLKSIAVLPFADLTPGKDMEYFGDGLAEELMVTLGKLHGLQVAGRRSSFTFKEKNEDVRQIGAALNVESVLEGSVRREGQRLRISAQLSRASDGYSLWTETYDRQLNDILDVQGAIAKEVARALNPLFVADQPIASRVRTNNPEAYAAYQRGVFAWGKIDLKHAREEFLRATQLDPQFAMAFAQLARTCDYAAYGGGENTDVLRAQVDTNLARALQLDPTLEDVWWIYSLHKKTSMGEPISTALLERAVAANSGDADAMLDLGRTYALFGRRDDSLAILERAYRADPMSAGTIYTLAYFSYSFKQDRKRFLELIDALERVDPESKGPLYSRADLAFFEGRPLDWDRYLAQTVERSPRDPETHAYLAKEYADLGLADASTYHFDLATKLPGLDPYVARTLAHVRLFSSGDISAAKRILQGVEERQPEDVYVLRAKAEQLYYAGDCAGSIEALVRSDPSLGSPAAIDIVGSSVIDWDVIPWLVWCSGRQGNLSRQAEIAKAWDLGFGPPSTPDVGAMRARTFAARGDREGLIDELQRLANGPSPGVPFSRFEPMIQPFLKDPEIARLLAVLDAHCAEWRKILPKSSMRVPIPEPAPKSGS